MRKKRFGFFNKQRQFEQDMLERGIEYEYSSFYTDSFKQLKKNKMAMFCAGILLLLMAFIIQSLADFFQRGEKSDENY